jgi:ABC-type multidrug transport system fused ATPase/permease subunit
MFKKLLFLLDEEQKKSTVKIFIFLLVAMLLEVAGIGIVIPMVGLVIDSDTILIQKIFSALSSFGITDYFDVVIFILFLFTLFFLIKSIFLTFVLWIQSKFIYNLKVSISDRLFKKYLSQKYSFHLNRNSAEFIRNINNEVDTLSGTINFLLTLVAESLISFGILLLLIIIEPIITITVIFLFGTAALLFYYFIRNKSLSWGLKRQKFDGKKIQQLQQAFGGIKEVKLRNKETFFENLYSKFNLGSSNMSRNQSFISTFPRYWLEFLVIVCFFLIVYILKVSGGTSTSILPTLAIFGAAAFKVYPSTNKILSSAQMVRYNLPVVNLIFAEMNLKNDNSKLPKENMLNKEINFNHKISININEFRYSKKTHKVLNEIKFEILKGESIGIIGQSGAGKSTLIDIILGLLELDENSLSVDGKSINNNITSWQNKIGYVPQNIYLMDDSLKNNIAFGIKENLIDDDSLKRSIKLAQLEKLVDELSEGEETFIGENGARLSGGQKQRIGIARALYSKPEVLVFDESTSALDYNTEKEIFETVKRLKGVITSIIISHKVDNLSFCDKILFINEGKIGYFGNYENLPIQNKIK